MLDKNCILKEAQNWLSCAQEGKNIYLNEEF